MVCFSGSAAAHRQSPFVCQIPQVTPLLQALPAASTAPNATLIMLCQGQGDVPAGPNPAILLGHVNWRLHQPLPFPGSGSAQIP